MAEALRQVRYPGYSRDIVSFGMLKEVVVTDRTLTVILALQSAKPEAAFQIQSEVTRVLQALPELEGRSLHVEITDESSPHPSGRNGAAAPLSPLQDELQSAGTGFDPDPMIAALARPDLAPGAGYGEDGPGSLGGPMGDRASTKWQGTVPVFQWEIDPSDPERQHYGESEAERDGWLFRTWWQVHPAGLVYASVSAIADEEEQRPQARSHPIGRNVAVNLVYDLRRQGVVAVYGTALDFRPFVAAFLEGFQVGGGQQTTPEVPTAPATTSPTLLTSTATNEGKSS